MKMRKIGVLYICTGKYSIFWKTFYQSCEEYFLPEYEKHYFVFTDDTSIVETDYIHVKSESAKGFPLDSLLRFDMFLSIKNQLSMMDYIYFFNSNMRLIDEIGSEILPTSVTSGLVAVIHPGYFNQKSKYFPYERSKHSTAFIKYNPDQIYNYFMGSLNGGRTNDYLKLAQVCSDNIHRDMKNGIMAIYHDESHLNNYLQDKDVLKISPAFAFPEDSLLPFDPKIIILNKMKHGGEYFDKLPAKAYGLRIYLKIKRLYFSIIWKFQ